MAEYVCDPVAELCDPTLGDSTSEQLYALVTLVMTVCSVTYFLFATVQGANRAGKTVKAGLLGKIVGQDAFVAHVADDEMDRRASEWRATHDGDLDPLEFLVRSNDAGELGDTSPGGTFESAFVASPKDDLTKRMAKAQKRDRQEAI